MEVEVALVAAVWLGTCTLAFVFAAVAGKADRSQDQLVGAAAEHRPAPKVVPLRPGQRRELRPGPAIRASRPGARAAG